jgi:hypothetical protein
MWICSTSRHLAVDCQCQSNGYAGLMRRLSAAVQVLYCFSWMLPQLGVCVLTAASLARRSTYASSGADVGFSAVLRDMLLVGT